MNMNVDEIARRLGFNRKFTLSLELFSDPVRFVSLIASKYGKVLVVLPESRKEIATKLKKELFPNIEVLMSIDIEDKIEIWVHEAVA